MFHPTYQYDIPTIVWLESVLYDSHLHFVQCRGWIWTVVLKLDVVHFVHNLNKWQVASVHSALVVLLSPTQLNECCIKLMFTLGKKDLVRNNSHKTMIQPLFCCTMFLCTKCLYSPAGIMTLTIFLLYSHTIYETTFHTKCECPVYMPGLNRGNFPS